MEHNYKKEKENDLSFSFFYKNFNYILYKYKINKEVTEN